MYHKRPLDNHRHRELCVSSPTVIRQQFAGTTPGTGRAVHRRRPLIVHAAASVADKAEIPASYVTREARRAIFSTAKEQHPEAEARLLSGRLPPWLRGTLLFNGGGEYRGMTHLFDGFACLTRIQLDGEAGVRAGQRFLQTDAYGSFCRTGRLKYREFETPVPADGPVGRALAVLENTVALIRQGKAFTDNAAVSIIPLPTGKALALSEIVAASYLVEPATLATGPQVEYPDSLPGYLSTAHPKIAPDGSLINFTRSLPFSGMHVFRQDPATLERKQIAFVRDRDPLAPCWVHDMAITTSHLIIVEQPLFFDMTSVILGTKSQYAFMRWRPEAGTKVHVVALDGSGVVVTHSAPSLFTFHFANAFEQPAASGSGTEICVDFSVYDDPGIINDLSMDRLTAFPGAEVSPSRLRRLTIPLEDAAGRPVGPTSLDAPAPLLKDEDAYGNFIEFPAFSPLVRGKPYRYVYGTAAVRPTNMGNALARHDLAEGTTKLWYEPGSVPTEPSFVPRPGATSEDDGVVLAVLARGNGSSCLLVLDACSMHEVARVALPFTVPYRFHGAFLSEGDQR